MEDCADCDGWVVEKVKPYYEQWSDERLVNLTDQCIFVSLKGVEVYVHLHDGRVLPLQAALDAGLLGWEPR